MRRKQERREGGKEAWPQSKEGRAERAGFGYLLSFFHGHRLKSRHLHPRSGNNPSLLDLISQSGCLGGPAVRWIRGQTSVHPAKGQGRGDHTGRQGRKGTVGPLLPLTAPSRRGQGPGSAPGAVGKHSGGSSLSLEHQVLASHQQTQEGTERAWPPCQGHQVPDKLYFHDKAHDTERPGSQRCGLVCKEK